MLAIILFVMLFVVGAVIIISNCCGRKIYVPVYEIGRIDPVNNSRQRNYRNNQTTEMNSYVETSGQRNNTEPELNRILRILNMDYRCYPEPASEERRIGHDELPPSSADIPANQEIRRNPVPESVLPERNSEFIDDPPPSYDEAVGNLNTINWV